MCSHLIFITKIKTLNSLHILFKICKNVQHLNDNLNNLHINDNLIIIYI